MVGQAICSCGKRSRPYFTTTSMYGDIYLNECLEKRLLPFIRTHNIPTFFCPDLATCHCTKNVTDLWRRNHIEYVQKDESPSNCPELRPIKEYWPHMKRKLLKYKKPGNFFDDFKIKWNRGTILIPDYAVRVLMEGIKRKLRNFWMNSI